jgi:hypothetical protein
MRPEEDLDRYKEVRPGVYYYPETGRYVTPIHDVKPGDLVYNSSESSPGRREANGKASELPVIKKGSKEWKDAVKDIKRCF